MDLNTLIQAKFKEKNLSEKTINLYLRNLEKLNDGDKIKNLNFLNDTDIIIEKLNKYKGNTQRIYLISIVSTLGLFKDTKKYKKLYDKYYLLMKNKDNELKNVPTDEMNENQQESWISWDKLMEDYNKLKEKVLINIKNKTISDKHDKYLLPFIVLSLYTLIEPRRNQDFQYLYVVNKYDESLKDDKNYLDLENKQFIFNIYKTQKKHGSQHINIPNDLFENILLYLNNYPLKNEYKNIKKSKKVIPLLVDANGDPLKQVNSITRILNKISNGLSSSLIRHIYITYKLAPTINKLEKIASNMGHTVEMQRDYIKDIVV